jgi:glycosyltransferase involved in cell wall biosynthesis
MSSRSVPGVIIDSSSLRYLHTGLGQFSVHLLKELSKCPFPEATLTAVAHPDCRALVPQGINWEPAHWFRRHAPPWLQGHLYPSCAIWHMTSENTRLTGIPSKASLVLTIHGLHFLDEFSAEAAAQELQRVQALVNRAAVLVTVSQFTANLVRNKLETGAKPIAVIPNGIEQSAVEAVMPSWAPRQKFLFSIGTFFSRKNFHVLVPMMRLLPEYQLVLAGDYRHPYGDVVREAIQQEGLGDRILMPGEVSEEEKQWLFDRGDAFLFPSLSEGFGIPIIEAFQRGKPVFCSRAGSLPEVGSTHAYYWDTMSPEHLAERVTAGLASEGPEKIQARRSYAGQFTWASVAAAYLKIYRSLLPSK